MLIHGLVSTGEYTMVSQSWMVMTFWLIIGTLDSEYNRD